MSASKLAGLRQCMQSGKYCSEKLTVYIIPTDDAHQSEYIAECDKRREFISGFSGSAGTAVVTLTEAYLWTDGRYHIQASQQLDDQWTLMKMGDPDVPTIPEWLAKLPSDAKIGFDPQLVSEALYKTYSEAIECSGQSLVPVSTNLVDVVWKERPARPANPLMVLPLKYTGRSWEEKIEDVRGKMEKKQAGVLVVTALDEVAWLLNLRGSDIEYNPVFFAYVIVTQTQVRLYIDESQMSEEVCEHLKVEEEGTGVKAFPYSMAVSHLADLSSDTQDKIWINSKSSYGLCSLVPKAGRVSALCPIQLLKAIKNDTEIQGMRNSHIRDAAALCEYIAWLEKEVPKGELTEISAADHLESLRKELPDYVSLSFPTISSSGPNGAVIHYRPAPETNRKLCTEELYLCDSGAQFRDGTTDVTRTMHFGTPTDKQKEAFTRVLKGHIALCTAVFPNKTQGSRLDSMARAPLWSIGLDYKHGTGHGVGAFLNVHEAPPIIGTRAGKVVTEGNPLMEGMFVSDEPGYYEAGEFGIRIENVVLIKPAETKYNYGGTGYLTMEPVTLVPIQSKMIVPSLLTQEEIDWLNGYHAECLEKVGSYLADGGRTEVLKWLQRETQPLG